MLAVVAGFTLLAPGCGHDPERKPSTSCAQNSDCKSPYICAIGKCRSRCATAADCGDGGSCITDEKGYPVCQPAAEKNTPCNNQDECTPPLACATDYRCRNLCEHDGDCNHLGVMGRLCVSDDNGTLFCADEPEAKNGVLTTKAAAGNRGTPVPPPTTSGGSSGATGEAGAGGSDEPSSSGTSGGGTSGGGTSGHGGNAEPDGSAGAAGSSGPPDEQVGANTELCPPPGQATTVSDATISADTTWQGVHVVSTRLNVQARLTLAPCAVVRLDSGADILVKSSGSLRAIGSEGKAVTFTSAKPAPAAGDWKDIYIDDSASNDSRFEQVVMAYGGSSYMVELDTGAAASFSHVTLRDSSATAVGLAPGVAVSEFENVRVERAGSYPLMIQFEDVHLLGSFSSVGSKLQAIDVEYGVPLTTPATWKDHGLPYALRDTSYPTYVVKAELTLAAGVSILMDAHSLSVEKGGALLATGTEDRPVTFTSGSATPKPGDWGTITFLGTVAGNSLLDHTVVEYGSDYTISLEKDATTGLSNVLLRHGSGHGIGGTFGSKFSKFENVTVEDMAGYPIAVQASTVGDLGSLSATGCHPDQVWVSLYESVTRTATWKNLGIPYRLLDTSYNTWAINAPVTLEAGATLLLDSNKTIAIGAGGSLKAQGTEQKPITIGSSLPVPTPGSWGRISVAATAAGDSTLTWTTLKDASSGALTLSGSQFALDHATFSGNASCDVKVSAGTLITSAGGNLFSPCP